MAHYAKVENGIVTQVIVANSQEWCEANLGGTWVQTSYNTFGGEHKLGGTPLNKNYAGIEYTWDGTGFAPPKCCEEASFNNNSYLWECSNEHSDSIEV
jgi:hypothetical protein